MSELFHKLGLDWKLLLSQGVNFLVLLLVLRQFAYKPLLKILKDRRARIEEGLAKADEAENRLAEVDNIAKDKMRSAEAEAVTMMRAAEERSKKAEGAMLEEARRKEAAMLASAELAVKAKEAEAMARLQNEAAGMIKAAIVRTVEMDPKSVDETLIKKSVGEMAHTA